MLFPIEQIAANLLPRAEVHWFADIDERPDVLPEEITDRLTECARRWEKYEHPAYGDSYGEFARNRNRCNFEDMYINRRNALVDFVFYDIFVCADRYNAEIEALLRLICAEDTWCAPAHASKKPSKPVRHVIELYAAETAAVVSLTYARMKERLPEDLCIQIPQIIRERMFIPFTESDEYNWMGAKGQRVNNWNPWIHSNVLFCAALVCEDEEMYRTLVLRACALTENYVRSAGPECQCDEGVRYWNLSGACLFDLVEMIYDITGGAVDLTAAKQVRQACSYITAMYDENGIPANFADATIEFYPDAPLLARAGERIGDPLLRDMGRSLYRPERLRTVHDNFYRQLKDVLTAASLTPVPAPEYPPQMFLRGINVCTMRQNGFFLSFKGGHNGESHNHNDVGSFVLYHNGIPLFIDPGVDLYSGFTFSEWRFKLWYLRSDYHNLPVIGGTLQQPGAEFAAAPLTVGEMWAQTDISGAYGLTQPWIRRVEIADGAVIITDTTDGEPGTAVLHYMLKEEPVIEGAGIRFPCGVVAEWQGVRDLTLERIDITGENPPDGICGDAKNRREAPFSALIPRRFVQQWGQDHLWRLSMKPEAGTVCMTVRA